MDIEISLAAEPLTHLGKDFPLTNTFALAVVLSISLMIIGVIVGKKAKLVPSGLQNLFETILEFLLDQTDSVTGDRKKTEQFFPFVATLFILILCGNLTEIIPGLGTIGLNALHEGHEVFVPLLRSTSADLSFTLGLTIVVVTMSQYYGMKHLGFFGYMKKFVNFKSPMKFAVGMLEGVSEITKLLSLSFRLFGNLFAGEVLLAVVTGLTYVIAPLPFYALELFVGFVQAFVFSLLTLVYFSMATEEAH